MAGANLHREIEKPRSRLNIRLAEISVASMVDMGCVKGRYVDYRIYLPQSLTPLCHAKAVANNLHLRTGSEVEPDDVMFAAQPLGYSASDQTRRAGDQ